MKSMMKVFGIISPALLAVAALFKIQHWPGGGVMMTLGFFMLCCFFLPSAIYVLYMENKGKRFFLYLSGFISFFPWMAGTLFKVMHWPGAGILLTIGIVAMVILFLPTLLYVKIKDSGRRDLNPVYTIGVMSGMIYLTSLLFKIMHWPGAGVMFFFGAILLVVIFLPYYIIKVYKAEEYAGFEFIFLIAGILWFVLTTTLFNLNISRDIIGDFVFNQKNLTILNEQMEKKNANMYSLAEKSLDEMSKINAVQQQTNQLIKYIDELKSGLIQFSLVYSERGSNDDQNKIIDKTPNYADYRTPSIFMCGKESNGKAYELKSKLTDYKSYAGTLVSDREIIERINSLIDLDVPADAPPGIHGWEDYYFGDVILITAMDVLTNYQLRIRLTESELIQYLTAIPQSSEKGSIAKLLSQ